MTEDQVLSEFLQNFGDANKDGKLTRQVIIIFFFILHFVYLYYERNGMIIMQL